jgi:hypothetical protein
MKINELLNESDNEQLDEILGTLLGLGVKGAAKLGGALLRGSSTGKQALQAVRRTAPTMAGSTRAATSILQRAGVDTSTLLNSKWRDLLAWQIQRKGMKAFKLGQAAAYENSKIAINKLTDLGLHTTGLITSGIELTQYFQVRQALQEKYADDPAKLDEELNSLNVSTVASLFLPRVIGSVGRLSSKAVGGIIGAVSRSPRAGAMVKQWLGMAAKMGETAAMVAFRTTDAGKKWLADALAFISLGIGSASSLLETLGELLGAGLGTLAGLAASADPDLITIGMAGKWLPSLIGSNSKSDQADAAAEPKKET